MKIRHCITLAGAMVALAACASRQTEEDTGAIEPAAADTTMMADTAIAPPADPGMQPADTGMAAPTDPGMGTDTTFTDPGMGTDTTTAGGEVTADTAAAGGEVTTDTATAGGTGAVNPENQATVSDSAAANQTKMGVTDTETGQATTGEGVTELDPTEGEMTAEQRQKLEEAGQDSAFDRQNEPVGQQQADTTGQQQQADTTTGTTAEKPPK